MKRRRMVVAAGVAIVALWSFPAFATIPYKGVDVKDGGTIAGTVRLAGPVPKPVVFETGKDPDWCGTRRVSPRLVLGANGGVANAVISIEGISQGKRFAPERKYILDQRKCEYVPHVLLLPLGADLEIVNSDAVLHNVHTYAPGKEPRTVFNIAQPVKGVRFRVTADRLTMPGIYAATCDAGHPWMSAYVAVAEHPYYAVTGTDGQFSLSNVPPGTYTLKMWREGVAVTRVERRNGEVTAYQYEPPYEMEQTVVVSSGTTTRADFQLLLRPAVYGTK
jgi:hypothetical protein